METDKNQAPRYFYIYGQEIDELLLRASSSIPSENFYYHYDGLGSVVNLTKRDGQLVESTSYDVYGKPNQTSSVGNTRMFTGREYESETRLYYYRARYYSPTIGRFLQKDLVGYIDGANVYSYVNNNPINYIDPMGLRKKKTGWWPKELDLVVPGYRNYGGPSRMGPGEPEDLMDAAFQRHDSGYARGELEQSDLRLLNDLKILPSNPTKFGKGVNPFYAEVYRVGAYAVFSTRVVIVQTVKRVTASLKKRYWYTISDVN